MKTYDERMASVQMKLHSKQVRRRVIMTTSLMLCVCIVAGVLFMPYDNTTSDIQMYAGSDYYEVIKILDHYNYDDEPQYINLFDKVVNSGVEWKESLIAPDEAPMAPGAAEESGSDLNSSTNSSIEITDHQVAGVHEGDLIKRSETHVFYLNGSTLEVYSIAGEETERISMYTLRVDNKVYHYNTEMYLSADATRLTLIVSGYGEVLREGKKDSFVKVILLDVSNPGSIKKVSDIYLTGNVLSSRMVGEQLMIMSQYRMDNKIEFADESTFLPQFGTPGQMQRVPADGIVIPDELSDRNYTVVTLLDSSDLSVIDAGAFMSYSTQLYVSEKHIYATRTYTEEEIASDFYSVSKAMSEVSCMAYGEEGLTNMGTFSVEGTVKNQYSMDEHEGIFRIVTATNRSAAKRTPAYTTGTISTNTAQTDNIVSSSKWRSANLTCFKVGTWEQVAQVAQFAPEGETVESVRFDGDYAYVCTAVVITLTDPVFFFDMTDLDNIIVKDTGTIDGYSSSLIQLEDDYLMGIGYDDAWKLKIEVYEETTTGVKAVCEYILRCDFASDYKAYYIERENNIFGIPTSDGYILLQFNGYELVELVHAQAVGDLNATRGVIIDRYLYVFGTNAFVVLGID